MKVLLVNTLYYPESVGGAEKSVQQLAESLLRIGVSVKVVTLDQQADTDDEVNSVSVRRVKLRNVYWPYHKNKGNPKYLKPFFHLLDLWNLAMNSQLVKEIKSFKPDVVHTHNLQGFSTAVWRYLKKKNIPVVHTLRDYYLTCIYTKMYKNGASCASQCQACKIATFPKQLASQNVAAVVGISRHMLQKHLENNYFSGVEIQQVIPNGVRHVYSAKEKINADSKVIFGYLGRLSGEKGVDYIIDELNKLEEVQFQLKIAGSGEDNFVKSLKSQIIDPDKIRFEGFVDSNEFLKEVDFLIVPSKWEEPFGRVIVESWAHGVPVLASDRGGLPELVKDGESGFVFSYDEPESFRNAVVKICDIKKAEYEQLSANVIKLANSFKNDFIAEKYLELYTNIAK